MFLACPKISYKNLHKTCRCSQITIKLRMPQAVRYWQAKLGSINYRRGSILSEKSCIFSLTLSIWVTLVKLGPLFGLKNLFALAAISMCHAIV